MSSQVTVSERKGKRRMWPVMGFVLIVAVTIIAYGVAPQVVDWVRATFRGFSTQGMTQEQVRVAFTAIVAVLMTLVTALVISIAAPKKAINVRLGELQKERVDLVKDKRERKRRQRRINRMYREHVEGKNK
jgi:type VI protein secretion system component VasK